MLIDLREGNDVCIKFALASTVGSIMLGGIIDKEIIPCVWFSRTGFLFFDVVLVVKSVDVSAYQLLLSRNVGFTGVVSRAFLLLRRPSLASQVAELGICDDVSCTAACELVFTIRNGHLEKSETFLIKWTDLRIVVMLSSVAIINT